MLKRFIAWLGLMMVQVFAFAASQDADFLAAREAFRVGDAARLERYARSLNGHVLQPYVDYWRLKLRLENASPDEVRELLARLGPGLVADRLRLDWLKVLGMRQRWELFDAEYPQVAGEDAEVLCYALQSRWRAGEVDAPARMRALWLNGRDAPESCTALFNTLAAQGELAGEDIWTRIRLALEAGNTGVATRAAEYLPPSERPDPRSLARVAVNAQAYLDRKSFDFKTRAGRETLMFAVHRLARASPPQAAVQWLKLGERVGDAERSYVWGFIAYFGAQRLDPNALAWYARADRLNDQQAAWKTRAALRERNWEEVLAAIEAMSAKEAQEPAWRYWRARALQAMDRATEARELLAPLALEFNFYGQLAAEELGNHSLVPAASYRPGEEEVQAIGRLAGFQRALAFYRLNLRFEGNREWLWTIRGFDDRQLLAAAEFAHRNELYDRAINTADKTAQLHDFNMRYPTPYRDAMRDHVAQQRLDEALVYGLIRQESRFLPGVKSSAGAIGLMQLMPATARWVAKKMGLKDYRWSQTTEIATNVSLGTWYLRHVLDLLDNQPVLASAAYNAGPGRARGWRADVPMEAAIYAETIPFNETRDYVKKVMSNAAYYGQQFGQTLLSLKERIGVITPRGRAAEKPIEDSGS